MPLIKRDIQPVNLSRADIPKGVSQELECVTNGTLANIIRQLSGLSKHAEDLFGELSKEANGFFERACLLQDRVDKLKVKVTQLDSNVEEVSLQDINMRKPFRSSQKADQQVVSRTTIPTAMLQTYQQCDKPPPLDKVNKFREDGKDSLKVYTDPTYFFNLWYEEIRKGAKKQREEQKEKKKRRPVGKGSRKAPRVREVKTHKAEYQQQALGKEFQPDIKSKVEKSQYQNPQALMQQRPVDLEIEHLSDSNYSNQTDHQGQNAYQNGPVLRRSISQEERQYTQQNTSQDGRQQLYQNVQQDRVGNRVSRNHSMYARPSQAPPPPPPPLSTPDSAGSSPGSRPRQSMRQDLPPPPPPPLDMQNPTHHKAQHQYTPSPGSSPSKSRQSSERSSPALDPYRIRTRTPDSMNDLPPPPPPPPLTPDLGTPQGSGMLPPPPAPPPIYNSDVPVPPPPPPPLVNGGIPNNRRLELPQQEKDNVSISSSTSSMTTASSIEPPPPLQTKAEPIKDERSDLLAAIRQGVQLKKAQQEERERNRRQQDTNRPLDVQTIMDRAFEMRRKAMEDTDSEEDDYEEDGNDWDDEDV